MHLLVFTKFLTPWEVQMRKMLSESKPLPSQIPSELWLERYNPMVQRLLVLREGLHNTKELNFIWFCYKEAILTATLQSALWVVKPCGLMISTESSKVFNNQCSTLRRGRRGRSKILCSQNAYIYCNCYCPVFNQWLYHVISTLGATTSYTCHWLQIQCHNCHGTVPPSLESLYFH